ncbi:MAG: ferredoxin [Nocardioides sp.]
MSRQHKAPRTWELIVDWPACAGRGVCHEVLPELITLDDWGYPIVHGKVDREHLADAKEAVRVCPQLALRLRRSE